MGLGQWAHCVCVPVKCDIVLHYTFAIPVFSFLQPIEIWWALKSNHLLSIYIYYKISADYKVDVSP